MPPTSRRHSPPPIPLYKRTETEQAGAREVFISTIVDLNDHQEQKQRSLNVRNASTLLPKSNK